MNDIEKYIESIDPERREAFLKLFNIVKENIAEGFELGLDYNMPSFHVPLDTYPQGYLNRSNEPLPFISLAAQKNHIALYHMGVVADKDLRTWFVEEYKKQSSTKLDMGKSCIRFKKVEHIPYKLIKELVTKMSPEEWISLYENKKS